MSALIGQGASNDPGDTQKPHNKSPTRVGRNRRLRQWTYPSPPTIISSVMLPTPVVPRQNRHPRHGMRDCRIQRMRPTRISRSLTVCCRFEGCREGAIQSFVELLICCRFEGCCDAVTHHCRVRLATHIPFIGRILCALCAHKRIDAFSGASHAQRFRFQIDRREAVHACQSIFTCGATNDTQVSFALRSRSLTVCCRFEGCREGAYCK